MSTINQKGEALHEALFNSKNRDQDVLKIVLDSSREERISIRAYYDETYTERGLLEDIKKKLSGDFKDVIGILFLSRAEYDAKQIIRAMKGFSVEEESIYEIIFNRPLYLKNAIKSAYQKQTNKELADDLKKKFSGGIRTALLKALETERDTNENPSHDLCQRSADLLIKEKPNSWIDNNEIMSNIFLKMSPEELVLTARYYLKKTGDHIKVPVNSMKKQNNTFFWSLYYAVISPAEWYAKKAYEAIKGLGTDTNLLERCLVNRHDLDMLTVKKYYYKLNKRTLKEDVIGDCSGSYQDIMVGLVDYAETDDY